MNQKNASIYQVKTFESQSDSAETLKINKFSLEKNLNINEKKYNKFIDYYLRFKEVKETDLWDKIINKLKKND